MVTKWGLLIYFQSAPNALLTAALIYYIINELSEDESESEDESDSEDELLYNNSCNWSGVTSFYFFLSKIVHLSFNHPSYLNSFGGIFP